MTNDMTIFCIAVTIFFFVPIAIVVTALVADWRNKVSDQSITDQ